MEIEKYKSLDYKNWILGKQARKGINLKRLNILAEDELQIWNESIPYQDQRNDPGHGEITAYFVLTLLKYTPGKREIALPAAILHDVGWYGNDPNEWKKLVNLNKENLQILESEAMRRPHQNRGVLIAGKILEKVGYFERTPISNGLEIADIIGDHDTRKLPASENGKIVRIADLLWRVTYPCIQIYMENESPEYVLRRFKETCVSDDLLPHLGQIGEKIARIEFVNMMDFKFSNRAKKILEKHFTKEFELVKSWN